MPKRLVERTSTPEPPPPPLPHVHPSLFFHPQELLDTLKTAAEVDLSLAVNAVAAPIDKPSSSPSTPRRSPTPHRQPRAQQQHHQQALPLSQQERNNGGGNSNSHAVVVGVGNQKNTSAAPTMTASPSSVTAAAGEAGEGGGGGRGWGGVAHTAPGQGQNREPTINRRLDNRHSHTTDDALLARRDGGGAPSPSPAPRNEGNRARVASVAAAGGGWGAAVVSRRTAAGARAQELAVAKFSRMKSTAEAKTPPAGYGAGDAAAGGRADIVASFGEGRFGCD